MELYVVRHPPVDIASGICYGQTDMPATAQLAAYAAALHPQLGAISNVYSSPLSRCRQLALALHIGPVYTDDRLQEMHFGKWENCAWTELDRAATEHWISNIVENRTPAGESMRDVYHRVQDFLTELPKSESKVLIVTHAGVIRCMQAILEFKDLRSTLDHPIAYGQIYRFDL